ncbi:MAG: TerB family tellurite resistance protein [Pseudomonadota bacterium]
MPFILTILGLLGAVAIWYWRMRMARHAAGEVAGAARDVKHAARRFAYRRRSDKHPADCVEDPRLAAAGIAAAIAAMDAPLSQAEIKALGTEARVVFKVDPAEAQDIAAFGRWIAGQCQTPSEAVRRLARVVQAEAGVEAGEDLLRMATRVATADGARLGDDEEASLATIRRTLGMA